MATDEWPSDDNLDYLDWLMNTDEVAGTSLRQVRDGFKALRADRDRLREEIAAKDAEIGEWAEELRDAIHQACADNDGNVDSMALSSYASALHLLAKRGLFVIEKEIGRRVIGHWAAPADEKCAPMEDWRGANEDWRKR
jgi:hypothetical protein